MQKEELLQAMAENTRGGGIVSDGESIAGREREVTFHTTGVLTREQVEEVFNAVYWHGDQQGAKQCKVLDGIDALRATITQQAQELGRLEGVCKERLEQGQQLHDQLRQLYDQLAASQARCREMERDKEQAVYALGQLEEKYLQLQATLAAREARIAELEDWQKIVLGSGTEQETVIRMAANEYTKTAVQCWKDHTKKIEAERDAAVQEAGRLREVLEYYAQTAIGARAIAALKAQQAAGDSPAGQTPPNFREAP